MPPLVGAPGRVAQKNLVRQYCVCHSTSLHENLISMFRSLEEERTRFRKKKETKKKE